MINLFNNLRLILKVFIISVGSVVLTAMALLILTIWQSGEYHRMAQNEVNTLIDADLDHINQSIVNLIQTEDQAVNEQLEINLKIAKRVLDDAGRFEISSQTILWKAKNQFDNKEIEIRLPKVSVGGQSFEYNTDPLVKSPVVDETERLIDETTTLFQRMNDRGDMLRIATTVKTPDGKRAVGTYIPAILPNGSPNPVIQAVLKGESYSGRAYVLNQRFLTAYQPLKDSDGRIIGMLYVGIPLKKLEARVRAAIIRTKVGVTGYVFILGGTGEMQGRYIISKDGLRDGEYIYNEKDASGRYFIRSIVSNALTLKPGQFATEYYPWQNLGEPEARMKIARIAYYQPWDWVIGTSVYEDELMAYRRKLSDGLSSLIAILILAAGIITVGIGLLGIFFAWTITKPIRRMTAAVSEMLQENVITTPDSNLNNEIDILQNAFERMQFRIRDTMEGLRRSEKEIPRHL